VSSADSPRIHRMLPNSSHELFGCHAHPEINDFKPPPSSMAPTRFFADVVQIALHGSEHDLSDGFYPCFTSNGRKISNTPFVARAAIKSSGTKYSPSSKSSPALLIAGAMAPVDHLHGSTCRY